MTNIQYVTKETLEQMKAELQHLQAALLLVALTCTFIAPVPATTATDGHGHTQYRRYDAWGNPVEVGT